MSDSAQGLLPGTPPRRRPSIRDANTTQYSRSQASHSSGSLGVDDSPETSAQQSPSGSTSPTKQKRSSYRRKSSAATAGQLRLAYCPSPLPNRVLTRLQRVVLRHG